MDIQSLINVFTGISDRYLPIKKDIDILIKDLNNIQKSSSSKSEEGEISKKVFGVLGQLKEKLGEHKNKIRLTQQEINILSSGGIVSGLSGGGMEDDGDITQCKDPIKETNVVLDDIIGIENIKKDLFIGYIYPFRFSGLFPDPTKGLLLYGPPGTGKTTIAKAVVSTFKNVAFYSVTSADIKGKYEGDTQKNLKKLFTCAGDILKNQPERYKLAIIFFDEFEEIAGRRGGDDSDKSASRAVPLLLQLMQGIESNRNISVIASTNYISNIDEAVLRRFSSQILVGLPQPIDQKQMIYNKLAELYNFPLDKEKRKNELRVTDSKGSGGLNYLSLLNLFGYYKKGYTGIIYSETGKYLSNWIDKILSANKHEFYSGADLNKLIEKVANFSAVRALCLDIKDKDKVNYVDVEYDKQHYLIFINVENLTVEEIVNFIKTNNQIDGLKIKSHRSCPSIAEQDYKKILNFSLKEQDFTDAINAVPPTINDSEKLQEYTNRTKA